MPSSAKKKKREAARAAEAEEAARIAAAEEAARAGPAAPTIHDPVDEAAARAASDAAAGLDYERESDQEEEEDANAGEDLGAAMDVEYDNSPSAAPDDLAAMTPQELQVLLYNEEMTRNIIRIREGLAILDLSPSSAAYSELLTKERSNSASPAVASAAKISVSSGVPISSTPSGGSLSPGAVPFVPSAHADNSSSAAETVSSPASEPVSSPLSGSSPSATSSPDIVLPRSANSTPAVENIRSGSAVTADRSYLQAASQVTVSPTDLRGLPLLTGSADQDVSEILSHYRFLCKLKADVISAHPDVTDAVALRHVALIGQGEVLTFIQQLFAGQIDCSQAGDSPQLNVAGSFPPPRTWDEMRAALLDFLLPANSIDEGAFKIATFQQGPTESVSSYGLRFRTMITRFRASVIRGRGNRTPWDCMTIALWRNGLKPAVHVLQRGESVKYFKEAVDLARRLEATGLAETQVSSIAVPHPVPRRTAARAVIQSPRTKRQTVSMRRSAQQQQRQQRPQQHQGKPRNSNRSGGQREPRRTVHWEKEDFGPCTHPTCKSHHSHPIERCFVKEDEERKAAGLTPLHRKRSRKKQREYSSDSE